MMFCVKPFPRLRDFGGLCGCVICALGNSSASMASNGYSATMTSAPISSKTIRSRRFLERTNVYHFAGVQAAPVTSTVTSDFDLLGCR